MRAKKSLGQHFLKSEKALNSIVRAGKVTNKDIVVEIGPGTGTLTKKLLATNCKVLAIEKDGGLCDFLKNKFEKEIAFSKLILIHDDILNFKPAVYNLEPRNYKIVANIPYNLTGIILRKFLETDPQPERMVLLVQKEVAERIIGTPHLTRIPRGKTKESILSISVKAYGTPRYIETVKAGSFVPVPKVDSAIIIIDNISKIFFKKLANTVGTECQQVERKFFEMVRAGFRSKRKKLSSNLLTVSKKETVKNIFSTLELDENLRAEDVGIESWQKLAQHLIRS